MTITISSVLYVHSGPRRAMSSCRTSLPPCAAGVIPPRARRFGLAFALSLSILVSLFAFGGVGAASSALHSSAAAVRSAVGDDNGKGRGVAQGTPSDRQYHHTVFICLPSITPQALRYVTRRVSEGSVPALVSRGALIPCRPAGVRA